MTTCCDIWKAICRALFEAHRPHSGVILTKIKAAIVEIEQLPSQRTPTRGVQVDGRWHAPLPGTIRIRCDASWCTQVYVWEGLDLFPETQHVK